MIIGLQVSEDIIRGFRTQLNLPVAPLDESTHLKGGMIVSVTCSRRNAADRTLTVGRHYSLQRGLGQPTLLWKDGENKERLINLNDTRLVSDDTAGWREARVLITSIKRIDVRGISKEDAIASSYSNQPKFWFTWAKENDSAAKDLFTNALSCGRRLTEEEAVEIYKEIMSKRPDHLYQAWAIKVSLVED